MSTKKLLFLILFLTSPLSFSTDYTDDASKVDFYVPGVLANDGLQMVNFLLCFMESTNFSTFIGKGKYAALVDEAVCENASGADGASDAASATGGSANSSASGGAANEISTSKYTYGIYQNEVTGNSATGVGWINLLMEMGANNTVVKSTASISIDIKEDKSLENEYGTFTLTYEIRNDADFAHEGGFNVPANTILSLGFLDVSGTTIKYIEQPLGYPLRSFVGNLAEANNQQGYIVTNLRVEQDGGPPRIFAVHHKVNFNESTGQYCQKYMKGQEYSFNIANAATAGGTSAIGGELNDAAMNTIITTAQNANLYVDTAGGSASTIVLENCWDTRSSQAKRIVYEYGTYKKSDESRYDLDTPSLNLRADANNNPGANLTRPIYAHASYWGTHVNLRDRATLEANPDLNFKNQRKTNDSNVYKLTKDYIEIERREKQTGPLIGIDGTQFQWYIKHYSPAWQTKLQALDSTNGITAIGNCTAAGGCPEYKGVVTVNNGVVTFTLTHGMDWDQAQPVDVKLTNPITFTNTAWVNNMTINSWSRGMHFWSRETNSGYNIPYAAMQNPSSNAALDHYSTSIVTKLTLDQLLTELPNPNMLYCIRECLATAALNTAYAAAVTEYNKDQTANGGDYNNNNLPVSPYYELGPYYKENAYLDTSGNGDYENGEPLYLKGSHKHIGGSKTTEMAQYLVSNNGIYGMVQADQGYINWTNSNQAAIDGEQYRDKLRDYKYYDKPAGYYALTSNENTREFGYAFSMEAVSVTDISFLECDDDGTNFHGYNQHIRNVSNNAQVDTGGTTTKYYCPWKMDEAPKSYRIKIKKSPNYTVTTGTSVATISPPEIYEYVVPAGLTYNFAGTNMEGEKIRLKFEGFGSLHNLPGRVYDHCTDTEYGRYYRGQWDSCKRFVHEFIIPEGSEITKVGGTPADTLKIRPLKGDEYIKALTNLPTNRLSYDQAESTLPQTSSFKNLGLVGGPDYIGAVPTTDILNNGEPSVIHGETIVPPQ